MTRLLRMAMAAVFVLLPEEVEAQAIPWIDIGIYGGMAATTPWFSAPDWDDALDADVDLGIGANPIFGANATYWPHSMFGVRAHLGYLPSPVPHTDEILGFGVFPFEASGAYPLNNYFVDLSGVVRPFGTGAADLGSSFYFWFGGGLMFTNAADNAPRDDDRYGCSPSFTPLGACLPDEPRYATVGQFTTGVGLDVIQFNEVIGIFGELGAHGYDSPVHLHPAFGQDRFAWTFRGVAGVKIGLWWPDPPPVPVRTVAAPPSAPAPLSSDRFRSAWSKAVSFAMWKRYSDLRPVTPRGWPQFRLGSPNGGSVLRHGRSLVHRPGLSGVRWKHLGEVWSHAGDSARAATEDRRGYRHATIRRSWWPGAIRGPLRSCQTWLRVPALPAEGSDPSARLIPIFRCRMGHS